MTIMRSEQEIRDTFNLLGTTVAVMYMDNRETAKEACSTIAAMAFLLGWVLEMESESRNTEAYLANVKNSFTNIGISLSDIPTPSG
jgi:hypothetical protein